MLIKAAGVERMMRFIKRVAGNGHVTVPCDLRSALAIESGDLVEFEVLGIVRPARPLAGTDVAAPTASATVSTGA